MEELRKLLHKLQFDYYEHGSRLDTIVPDSDIKPILEYIKNNFVPLGAEVKVNFADLVDLLTDIEKHLDELYELAVIPEHLVSTYGNSQMNIGQRILELKSKISA